MKNYKKKNIQTSTKKWRTYIPIKRENMKHKHTHEKNT